MNDELALFPNLRRGAYVALPSADEDPDLAEARRLIANNRAASTIEKYTRSWALFVTWVMEAEPLHAALPAHPALVGKYIGAMRRAGQSKAWILGKLAAIAYAHKLAGLPKPWLGAEQIESEIEGLRRDEDDERQERQGLERDQVASILHALPEPRSLLDLRNRAIFTIAWLSAQRRSTIAALRRRDIAIKRDLLRQRRYLEMFVARSKSDQRGRGRWVTIVEIPADHLDAALCAVRAVDAWCANAPELNEPDAQDLPLFRTFPGRDPNKMTTNGIAPLDVTRIVKRFCEGAGLDPDGYAAHSLRRGFAASADAAGIAPAVIMEQGGWKTRTMLDLYSRAGGSRSNATADLFSSSPNRDILTTEEER